MRGVGGVRKSIHQSWLAKRLGLLCWGFKGVQEEIPREEASTLQIGSVAFPPGQCTSPQMHPCHRLFDQDGQLQNDRKSNLTSVIKDKVCLVISKRINPTVLRMKITSLVDIKNKIQRKKKVCSFEKSRGLLHRDFCLETKLYTTQDHEVVSNWRFYCTATRKLAPPKEF